MEYNALARAAEMLTAMAKDVNDTRYPKAQTPDTVEEIKNIETIVTTDKNASEKNLEKLLHPEQTFDNVEGLTDIIETIPTPTGVELDVDGLPWDVRIHSKNKSKLAKTEQWKKKRGIDAVLVETVEAELRAAMGAGTPSIFSDDYVEPVLVETIAPPPIAETIAPPPIVEIGIPDTLVAPAPPIVETAITFPEIMSKITAAQVAGTITDVQVLKAVNDQGLASLALLAVRPDLTHAVNTALFG